MNPVVSVIIPSYNTAALIGRAIHSARSQSLSAIEIIVVDDASSDDSVAVVERLADERIRLIALPTNQGAAAARNHAIDAARGKWVAVLDSDDWYEPTRLQRLVDFAETRGADIVADDLHLIRDGEAEPFGTLLGQSAMRLGGRIEAATLVESETFDRHSLRLGLCKPVFLRSFLIDRQIRYDPTIKVTHDFWMLLECLIQGAHFELLPEPLYCYVVERAGSLVTTSRNARLERDIGVCAAVMARPEVAADPRLLESLEEKHRLYSGLLAFGRVVAPFKAGQWSLACRKLLRERDAWSPFIRRLPEALMRRFRRYVLRDKSAFDMLYAPRGRRR
ncbi:glycosyltransferase family 2 protein [Methylolobus aquaticus]